MFSWFPRTISQPAKILNSQVVAGEKPSIKRNSDTTYIMRSSVKTTGDESISTPTSIQVPKSWNEPLHVDYDKNEGEKSALTIYS